MQTLQDIKRELLASPATQAAYDGMAAEFDLTRELIAARSRAGLTQGDVAQRMGTTQSVIARLEDGERTPSLRTVQRYAQAVGARSSAHRIPNCARVNTTNPGGRANDCEETTC